MASAKQRENLLLTEHFSWTPISLIDEIINSVNEVLYKCTDALETGLTSSDPANLGFADRYAAEGRIPDVDEEGKEVYEESRLEIEEGMHKLETLMEGAVDRNFDRLEIWVLRNVLRVDEGKGDLGAWVRLGHYENLQIPPKDPNITPESLHALRRKYQETQKLNTALHSEKRRNALLLSQLRAMVQPAQPMKQEHRSSTSSEKPGGETDSKAPFAFLTHTPAAQDLGLRPLPLNENTANGPSSESRTPLTTHTTFTASQLPYLRDLLSKLKPHLSSTALPLKSEGEKEELARERKDYIESQSKRILERRGVDTVDGVEGVVEGSRVRAEEIRGLEGIVDALGKQGGNSAESEAMDTS